MVGAMKMLYASRSARAWPLRSEGRGSRTKCSSPELTYNRSQRWVICKWDWLGQLTSSEGLGPVPLPWRFPGLSREGQGLLGPAALEREESPGACPRQEQVLGGLGPRRAR